MLPKLKEKIDIRLRALAKNTGIENDHITHFEELSQLDIMDYYKLIEFNWPYFADILEDKSLVRNRFNAFRNLRNDIKHSKQLDPVLQKEGEAAVEWFDRVLKRTQSQ
jgi:hypothetical protein